VVDCKLDSTTTVDLTLHNFQIYYNPPAFIRLFAFLSVLDSSPQIRAYSNLEGEKDQSLEKVSVVVNVRLNQLGVVFVNKLIKMPIASVSCEEVTMNYASSVL
jgi:hypothetical protein